MMIRKQDNTQLRRKEQRSSKSTEENGNHTEETQNGPSQISPNIGVGQENGKKLANESDGSERRRRKCCGVSRALKKKH
jgi:hypothetical protein